MNRTERCNLIARVNEVRTENKQIISAMNLVSKLYNIEFNDYGEFPRIYTILKECLPLVLNDKMAISDYEFLSYQAVEYMHNISVLCELQQLIK